MDIFAVKKTFSGNGGPGEASPILCQQTRLPLDKHKKTMQKVQVTRYSNKLNYENLRDIEPFTANQMENFFRQATTHPIRIHLPQK
jgi:hypothetical protein